MAELCAAKFIYLLYLSCVLIDVCRSYTEFGMDNAKICHGSSRWDLGLSRKHKLELNDTGDSARIFKLDRRILSGEKYCEFIVKAARGDGLFAVIQTISFRRNETTNRCIDYVEFEREDGHTTDQFCGQMNRRKLRYYPVPEEDGSIEDMNSAATYSEFDFKGKMKTRIFISKQRLLPNETLNLSIVYTPYKDCQKVKDPDEYPSTGQNTCIWMGYFCDGYRNCAFETCPDETDCEIVGNGTGTKVTVGAVTTIFLCFILFVMCLWTCRKHKKLCWSSDCAGPNVGGAGPLPMDRGTRDPTGRPMVPTAPMLDEAVPSPVQDKDLPPSYDSLFPTQTNAAAT